MAKQKWKEWAEDEEKLVILTAWARAGLTDEEVAKEIGISRSTLSDWKKKFESIRIALSTGKEYADRLVENSLFKKTQGYYVKVKKAFKVRKIEYDENGKKKAEIEELQVADETEYIEPDVRAIMFWLKNRMPDDWKDKAEAMQGDNDNTGIAILTPVQMPADREKVKEKQEKQKNNKKQEKQNEQKE